MRGLMKCMIRQKTPQVAKSVVGAVEPTTDGANVNLS